MFDSFYCSSCFEGTWLARRDSGWSNRADSRKLRGASIVQAWPGTPPGELWTLVDQAGLDWTRCNGTKLHWLCDDRLDRRLLTELGQTDKTEERNAVDWRGTPELHWDFLDELFLDFCWKPLKSLWKCWCVCVLEIENIGRRSSV